MSTNKVTYQGNPSINRERTQRKTFLLEEPTLADTVASVANFAGTDDEAMKAGEAQFPPLVQIYTHDGGYMNTVDDAWAVSDGDTLILRFWDPDDVSGLQAVGSAADMPSDGSSTVPKLYTTVTHVLDGVTPAAATNVEVAASLNADSNFTAWAYAAIGPTADRVSIYPKGPRATVLMTGGTAQAVLIFPAAESDNAVRTFTHVGPGQQGALVADHWDVAWDNDTKDLTVTNNTAATVNRIAIRVDLF